MVRAMFLRFCQLVFIYYVVPLRQNSSLKFPSFTPPPQGSGMNPLQWVDFGLMAAGTLNKLRPDILVAALRSSVTPVGGVKLGGLTIKIKIVVINSRFYFTCTISIVLSINQC